MTTHTFFCIDAHTCGNPVRVVAGGGPLLKGATVSERRQHFLAEYDWIRRGLMFEPRGHDMMSGSILYPPTRPDCDASVAVHRDQRLLAHVRPRHHRHRDGRDRAWACSSRRRPGGWCSIPRPASSPPNTCEEGGHVEWVKLTNVPAFLHADGRRGRLPGPGPRSWSTLLMAELLRHRRAAEELPGHGRSLAFGPDPLVADPAAAHEREPSPVFIPKTRPSAASAISCGRGVRRSRRHRRATRSSMARRRLIARPAAPALRRAWPSSRPKGSSKSARFRP